MPFHHQRPGREDDRGSAALTAAILAAVLLALPMMLLQAAMYFHSRNIAAAGARHGLEATRVEDGSVAAGTATARAYLDQAGGPLAITSVSGSRGSVEATFTVTGTVTAVIPGLNEQLSVTVRGPVERFDP